jgi:energy-coupling factor transport system ATP-binding protein
MTAVSNAPLARLEQLSYWYPGEIPALVEVNLDLEPGLTLVVGPSGGGKSSLLRLFNGLIPHFHGGRIGGSATVLGHDITRTPTRTLARDVGFVFQDPEKQGVYGSVEREVAFGLENLGFARPDMVRRVGDALERLELGALRQRQVGSLSGGERQRVAIASVLAMRPGLIVLDEPTSELDASGCRAVIDACIALARTGTAILVAEHRFGRLLPAATSFVRVDQGRVDGCAARPELVPARPRARASTWAGGGGTASWSCQNLLGGPAGIALLESPGLVGRAGEVMAVTGANGSGKTTLLRIIAGLLAPISGSVERRPGRVAYLPQDPGALLYRTTLLAEVVSTMERAREQAGTDRSRVADGESRTSIESEGRSALAEFGLAALADRDPRDLSAGERQRGALAVILAGHPSIALLDEPTRGMDDLARRALATVLDRLREDGCSIVVATHDEDLVEEIADRVVAIADGVLTEAQRVAPPSALELGARAS